MCDWSLVSYWDEDVSCIINVAEGWVKRLQTEKPSEVIHNKLYLPRVNRTSSLLLGAVEPPSDCPVLGKSLGIQGSWSGCSMSLPTGHTLQFILQDLQGGI